MQGRLLFRVFLVVIVASAIIAWTCIYSPFLTSTGHKVLVRATGTFDSAHSLGHIDGAKSSKRGNARSSLHASQLNKNKLKSGPVSGKHKSGKGSSKIEHKPDFELVSDSGSSSVSDTEENDAAEPAPIIPADIPEHSSNSGNKVEELVTAPKDPDDALDNAIVHQKEAVKTKQQPATKNKPDLSDNSAIYHKEIARHPPDEKCKHRLPKALIVGVQKCGTSALMYFLSFHPQISAVLHPPELMYFSLYFRKPLSWYAQQMNCSFSNQIPMEKSPPYFYRSQCVDRIRNMNKDIKIIVIVKDPVVRSLSAYAMAKAKKKGTMTPFENLVISHGAVKKSKLIVWSEYARYMGKWISGFGLNQIYVADGHALEDNPSEELGRIEEFLGIGSYFTADKFVINKAKGKQCFYHEQGHMSCLGANKGREHETLSPQVLQKLQHYFKPINERFFGMVKKRFDWGY